MANHHLASPVNSHRSDTLRRTVRAVTKAFVIVAAALGISQGSWALRAAPQQGAAVVQERVAALQQALKESAAKIRQYEWVETTTVSLKGDEKSKTLKRCYYGVDGKLQKVPIAATAPPPPSGGRLKQKIVANKKEELQDYMQQANALVGKYVPPNPNAIQRAKDANRIKLGTSAAGGVNVEIANYLLPGDLFTIVVDPAANRLLGMNVASYLDNPKDTVTLEVQMGALPDGASYAARTTLDAKAKNVRVVVENAGYRPLAR